MKLIHNIQRDYLLMWKCHGVGCGKWNSKGNDECVACGQTEPLHPEEILPKQRLIQILEVAREYAQDHGMQNCADPILRAVIVAYATETEGHLASLCSGFGGVHAHYGLDGKDRWGACALWTRWKGSCRCQNQIKVNQR